MKDENNLIWIDLEMTGLSPERDVIIEIATVVTDSNLNILAEGPVYAIQQPAVVLNAMDEWNTRQHSSSGLMQRVLASNISTRQAELDTLDFLGQWVPSGKSPMCGNSICQDRRFLARSMPQLEEYFFYRNLDVSTLKELCRRWSPATLSNLTKKGSHLALDDIRDSIAELQFYRSHILKI